LCGHSQPKEDIHQWNIVNIFKDEQMSRAAAKLSFFAWLYNPESNDIETQFYDREKVLDKYYENGYIKTPYGREIKVDRRRALNYLIQSTTSDRVLQKAVLLDQMLEGKKSYISHIVHDEVVIDYSREEKDLLPKLKEEFEDSYLTNISVGKNYYDLSDLKL